MDETASSALPVDLAAVRDVLALGGPVVVLLLALSVVVVAITLAKVWQFRAARVGQGREPEEIARGWRTRGAPSAP